ncbi:MAG TPA: GNAT family N-acetyltransferase [Pyrinomonadaceae bacterium]
MIIETERLTLRPLTADDESELLRMRSDEDVVRYLGGREKQTPEFNRQRLRFYIECYEKYGYAMFAAVRKSDGVMVGWGGLQPLEETGEIEVGYGFDKPYWGQGYATEIAAAWLRYGFEEAKLERIIAVAIPENAASRHVMEKLGMRYEKNATHYGHDCVFYSIRREEFKPRGGFYALHDS